MFVLTIDTCASIKGTQLPNVSYGLRMEWLFTAQPSGLLQKVPENKQMAVPSMKEDTLWCQTLDLGECETRKTESSHSG